MSIAENYRILARLGKQKVRKFGEVFSVEHRETGRQGVLKAVRKSEGHELAADRLRHEARFSFTFPGLPEILDFYESETEIILIRAYEPGIPLDEFWSKVHRRNQLTFLKSFFNKLVPLFARLREDGIVHCDLKPANFLIHETADDFSVSLIDFGLALRLRDQEQRSTLFPLGYAAPELLLNFLDIVDQRTDLFVLGIVTWRLWTGKLPLVHPNPGIYTNLQLTHPLPEDRAIPKELFAILAKMSHKHQFRLPPNKMDQEEVRALLSAAMNERYPSLEKVMEDLENLPGKRSFYQRISLR